VFEKLRTNNNREATRKVYNCTTPLSVSTRAKQISRNPKIAAVVQAALEQSNISAYTVVGNYKELMLQRDSLAVAKSATDSVAKIMGIDKPDQEVETKEQETVTNNIYNKIYDAEYEEEDEDIEEEENMQPLPEGTGEDEEECEGSEIPM